MLTLPSNIIGGGRSGESCDANDLLEQRQLVQNAWDGLPNGSVNMGDWTYVDG